MAAKQFQSLKRHLNKLGPLDKKNLNAIVRFSCDDETIAANHI